MNNKILKKTENILERKKMTSKQNNTEMVKKNEIKNLEEKMEEKMEEKIQANMITMRKKAKYNLQNIQKKRDILKGALKKTHSQKTKNRPFLMRLTKK